MKRLRELLRLRRQSGKVKVALLFFLLAGYLAWDIFAQLGSYVSKAGQPVEYVLASGGENILEAKLQQIQEEPEVLAVSRQREYAIWSGETEGARSLTMTELSPEYLSRCYGLEEPGEGNRFYLDKESFQSFLGSGAASPAQKGFRRDETRDKENRGSFLLWEGLPQGMGVCKGTSQSLSGSGTLRVMLRGRDISGSIVTRLEGLGFTVVNQEALLTENFETELLFARLWGGALSLALSVTAGALLFGEGRREVLSL